LKQIQGQLLMAGGRNGDGGVETPLSKSRPAAALAFYDLVTLLQQALALAILALLLLLDVGAFFVGHAELQAFAA
jgi:hypothetical protein